MATKGGNHPIGYLFTISKNVKVIFDRMHVLFEIVNMKHMLRKTLGSLVLIVVNTEHMAN